MEKKSNPVAPCGLRAKNKSKKIITFFICIVLLLINLLTFSLAPYGLGYKYYDNTVQIGVTQQKGLLEETVDTYLQQLTEDRILYLLNRGKYRYYI